MRTPVVVMTAEDFERMREESFKKGWNEALKHVQATNGEGVNHYL